MPAGGVLLGEALSLDRIVAAFQSPGWLGLFLSLAVVWSALAISIYLLSTSGSGFGAEAPDGPRDAPWTPPGAFIGAVWSLLYTLMAVALWLTNRVPEDAAPSLRLTLIVLIAFCLVWPFYAFDTTSRWPGLLGNLGILALSLVAIWQLWPAARLAAWFVAPVTLWISIATASILDGARRFGW